MRYTDPAVLLADAERHLRTWVPLLYLQEWDIRLKLVELPIIPSDVSARTRPYSAGRIAYVEINRPYWMGEIQDKDPVGQDLEETVIHESLHIRQADLKASLADALDRAEAADREIFDFEKEKYVCIMARVLKNLRLVEEKVLERLDGRGEAIVQVP